MTDEQTSDGIIRQLSDRLANKIAAGEVVQRPASVEKELVENAIDAGAESVEVRLKDAGTTLVQVSDDGCGMSASDAVRCFDRHATSKIQSIDDLERIRTLGFRGEALASIAAVSHVDLKTKRVEDDAGTEVCVEGGDLVHQRPCAVPNGTTIGVRNLFFNVPARRNFLKTHATELKHCTDTFQFLALSNPRVAFRLVHNDHEHYDLSAARTDDFFDATQHRIRGLFGDDAAASLVRIDDASSDLTVQGVVGRPQQRREVPDQQFLFVNDRYVRDRYLSHAVRKAYGDLLPEKTFPFFALFLEMNPQRVDVNVHPTKAEVKFDDQSGIYGFLTSAVRRALGREHLTPQFTPADANEDDTGDSDATNGTSSPRSFQPRGVDPGASRSSSGASTRTGGSSRSGASSPSRGTPSGRGRSGSGRRRSDRGASTGWTPPGEQTDALYRPVEADSGDDAESDGPDASQRRAVWSLHDTYLITPTDDGLMMVDQRAAHVRVLYEQALSRLEAQQGESQQLLFPQTVDLAPADADLLETWMPQLRALGFDLERLSGRTVTVRGVPVDVREGDEKTVLSDVLDGMRDAVSAADDERRARLARVHAQQNAVRRGQSLSDAERRGLLNDLFRCEMPYADPSGTPTILRMSMEEIQKRFQG